MADWWKRTFLAVAAASTLAIAVITGVGYFATVKPWATNQRLTEEKSRLELQLGQLAEERQQSETEKKRLAGELVKLAQQKNELDAALKTLEKQMLQAEAEREAYASTNRQFAREQAELKVEIERLQRERARAWSQQQAYFKQIREYVIVQFVKKLKSILSLNLLSSTAFKIAYGFREKYPASEWWGKHEPSIFEFSTGREMVTKEFSSIEFSLLPEQQKQHLQVVATQFMDTHSDVFSASIRFPIWGEKGKMTKEERKAEVERIREVLGRLRKLIDDMKLELMASIV